jgi:hypothetical protein
MAFGRIEGRCMNQNPENNASNHNGNVMLFLHFTNLTGAGVIQYERVHSVPPVLTMPCALQVQQ